ncbi:MAG TPA: imelysin family protein [Fulvivirga sp.]|nr:imelysin family protein [Fulvivirga sp.]
MNKTYITLFIGAILLFSCNESDDPSVSANVEKKQAIENYADIVLASYEDSYNTALTLQQSIDEFLAAPSEQLFENAKTAWKNARIPYGQTEAYRFYGGPIDNDLTGVEGLINAWPMDEVYIDYVVDNDNAGIINDATNYPTISKELLEELNEAGGKSETSISTGYHAIEFLLWGQDFSANGPGERPYTDYVIGANGTATNQERRGQYLKTVTALLLDNLATVRDEWEENGTYRQSFVNNANPNEIITKIFTGLGELSKGELSGERMFVAVDTQDQENEHSCFSDNTDVDIKMNFKGIYNVYYGIYKRVDGTEVSGKSFRELAQSLDNVKASAAEAAFADAEAKINLIPTPFDQAILNSPAIILDAVKSLSTLSDKLSDVALELTTDK